MEVMKVTIVKVQEKSKQFWRNRVEEEILRASSATLVRVFSHLREVIFSLVIIV